MPRIDLVVQSKISDSVRVQQLEGLFDVPHADTEQVEWHHDLPIEKKDWKIGAIIGPSGAGKTQIARSIWGKKVDRAFKWNGDAVVDDFAKSLSMSVIGETCGAVGFNTIPAWRRPFRVLSNGEQFRVTLARYLLEESSPIVVDEFTSVVDRQVAKIGSHAVQKYIRKQEDKQFVAVTCHYDIIDWLQPDWTFDPSTGEFEWRAVQPRPLLDVAISPVPRSLWTVFRRFHYLTSKMPTTAHTFCMFVGGVPACFCAFQHRPVGGGGVMRMGSRVVTLPDYQGIGLAGRLIDRVASWYSALGQRVHIPPAHPALIRAFDRNPAWEIRKKPGKFGATSSTKEHAARRIRQSVRAQSGYGGPRGRVKQGTRPNATFRYVGAKAPLLEARRVMRYFADPDGKLHGLI